MSSSLSRDPVPLGKSGISVSRLAWGMWRFAGRSAAEADTLVRTALDAGIAFLDAADIYGAGGPGFGAAEELLGEVLRGDPALRGRMVLASKGGIVPGVPYDSSRAYLERAVDASLRRIGTDRLDLWFVHRPDPLTHPAELAGTLDALVASGKVRAVGLSNHSPGHTRAILKYLAAPLAAIQPEFSPVAIEAIADGTLDLAMEEGAAVMAWSPLGGGRLGGGARDARAEAVAAELEAYGAQHGVDATVAAYAWLMAHPARPIPIVGSQRPGRIAAAARAAELAWTREGWFKVLVAARGERLP